MRHLNNTDRRVNISVCLKKSQIFKFLFITAALERLEIESTRLLSVDATAM